jgi:uncharacterized protein (TIGR03437 family)
VTFNGTPGPLMYVQGDQINAIAPWALQTGETVQVCVVANGAATNCLTWPVVNAAPGIFGAVNQDGTLNSASNPAAARSIVSIYGTGLGPISPPPPDGTIVELPLPAGVLPVTMYSINGFCAGFGPCLQPVPMLYAGPAPFEVAGVSQINFVAIAPSVAVSLYVGTGQCAVPVYVAPN